MSEKTSARLALYLSHRGYGSRRRLEDLIQQGAVKVNGVVIKTPVFFVTSDDTVTVREETVSHDVPRPRLFRYAKPPGLIVSQGDPQGRPTLFERLPAGLPRLIAVGRLDLNSQGLILLTNWGPLARYLEHPSAGLERSYRVRVYGKVDLSRLKALERGIVVKGIRYGPIQVLLESEEQAKNVWLRVSLWEGKNREIRKVMEALGLTVNRLVRLSYGPFDLGCLAPGQLEEIPAKDFAPFVQAIKAAT